MPSHPWPGGLFEQQAAMVREVTQTMTTESGGKVYLVGSGVGEPEYLTLRAQELLALAEVLIYDALVDSELLKLVPPDCIKIDVGKRGGKPSTPQAEINRLLVDYCRQGRLVVRLKSGDPFVFGRAQAEIQTLAKAECDFEVVPGLSSALVAPLLAGIPLTDPVMSRSFTVLTAHDPSALDWGSLSQMETLVILMGARQLPEIVNQLRIHGRSPRTPIAVIRWAGTPRQRVWATTVSKILSLTKGENLSPCVIVIGEVVKLRTFLRSQQRPRQPAPNIAEVMEAQLMTEEAPPTAALEAERPAPQRRPRRDGEVPGRERPPRREPAPPRTVQREDASAPERERPARPSQPLERDAASPRDGGSSSPPIQAEPEPMPLPDAVAAPMAPVGSQDEPRPSESPSPQVRESEPMGFGASEDLEPAPPLEEPSRSFAAPESSPEEAVPLPLEPPLDTDHPAPTPTEGHRDEAVVERADSSALDLGRDRTSEAPSTPTEPIELNQPEAPDPLLEAADTLHPFASAADINTLSPPMPPDPEAGATANQPWVREPSVSAPMLSRTQASIDPAQPLAGKTIVVTRAVSQSSQFTRLLEQEGATVLEMPTLEIGPPSSWAALDDAIAHLEEFDWLILTSANGVNYFFERLEAQGARDRLLDSLNIAVVGEKTARALEQMGLQPDFIPPAFVADSLVTNFPTPLSSARILFPRVETGGRDVLVKEFVSRGARVTEVPAYESRCPRAIAPDLLQAFAAGQVDVVTFASSKTVQHFCQLMEQANPNWRHWLASVCIASIGPQTSQACEDRLGRVDVEAEEFTLDGLTAAIRRWAVG